MRAQLKMLAAVVVVLSGIGFGVVAQINFNANDITFRDHNNPHSYTVHYGDLTISGGTAGTWWGWLTCNRIYALSYAFLRSAVVDHSLYVDNDLFVLGSVNAVVKNFIHPHPTDNSKLIRYIAIESGESLTLARGTAKTVNGQTTIELPEHFSLVTSKDAPITVILTPEGAPVLLYTKQKSREKVVVAMKPSDFSEFKDVEFSFQVTGVRDGFEKQEVIVDEDKLESSSIIRDDVKKRIDAYAERVKARRGLEYQEKE